MNKAITVIVPVYADWASLSECIDSLKKYLDKRHSVILINDCGPEADLMERNIKKAIKGRKNFEYYRNPKNLGFVKTCNRGALELDKSGNDVLLFNSDAILTEGALEQMHSVLYASKKHGAVSPRSNSSSTSSIPLRPRDGKPYTMEHSHEVFEAVKDLLPRYYVAPDSHGFCILIKRPLIDKYGLFDEIYGRGNAEESDFCMRIRRHGYRSLIANRAFVYHYHSRSFTAEEKNELKKTNLKILKERYPELNDILQRYVSHGIDAVDWFADVIADTGTRRIMIDLTHMPKEQGEDSEAIVALLKYLRGRQSKKFEYAVVTNPDVDDFFKFSKHGLRVLRVGEEKELFHLGYCPYRIQYPNDLAGLSQTCLKFVYADCIIGPALHKRAVSRDARRFADAIVGHGVSGHAKTADLLEKTAAEPVDTKKLRERWLHFAEPEHKLSSFRGLLKWSRR